MSKWWALLAAFGLLSVTNVQAADYPDKPIRIIVPFGAGGGADSAARLLSEEFSSRLGATIIVENRTGAGGTVGTSYAARAEPDGYTIAYTGAFSVINHHIQPNITYDIQTDFVPIGLYLTSPLFLLVQPDSGIESLDDLVQHARDNPGALSYASSGVGTPHHLGMELMQNRLDLEFLHVPYKGAGEVVAAGAGGQVDIVVSTPAPVAPLVAAGKLVPIAVMSGERLSTHPDLPAISELAPGFDVSVWQGLLAPAGTDPKIVDLWSDTLGEALSDEEFLAKVEALGVLPLYEDSSTFAARIQTELDTWEEVTETAGL